MSEQKINGDIDDKGCDIILAVLRFFAFVCIFVILIGGLAVASLAIHGLW